MRDKIKVWCERGDTYRGCILKELITDTPDIMRLSYIHLFDKDKEERASVEKYIRQKVYETIKCYDMIDNEDFLELIEIIKLIYKRALEKQKITSSLLGVLYLFLNNRGKNIDPRLGINSQDGIILFWSDRTKNYVKYAMGM